jgi:drug/metabolite transporter (DMT)-like permease
MRSKKVTGFFMAMAAAIAWGTFGTFSTILNGYGLDEGTVSLISPLCLLVFFSIFTIKNGWRNFNPTKKLVPIVLLLGVVEALFSYSTVQAYSHLPFALVSTIIYCNLFLLIILSRIIFKTRITWHKLVAVVAAVVGIAMVVNAFDVNSGINLIGFGWAALAMVCWATLVTCEKYLLEHDMNSNAVIAWEGILGVIFISIAVCSPIVAVTDVIGTFAAHGAIVLLPLAGFGLITTVFCYWMYINALDRLEPAFVQIAYTLDPTTSCLLGLVLFGQLLAPIQFIGIGIILVVVIGIQLVEHRADKLAAQNE